jgi:hypothetical protein
MATARRPPGSGGDTLPSLPGNNTEAGPDIKEVPPYMLHDFRGKYHLSLVNSIAPVAGSQLEIERNRLENLVERGRHAARLENQGVERRRMLDIAQRGLFKLTQATKENYGLGKTLRRNEMMNEFRSNELDRIVRAGQNIDPTVTKTFWRAVKYGDVPKVKMMVANGFEGIDMLDAKGESGLVHAVRNRHVDFAECLLELGAFPNAKDFSGSPALLMAWQDLQQEAYTFTRTKLREITEHILDMVNAFFAHGADPNAQQAHDGLTGLHLAMRFNQPKVALLFIKFGGDPAIQSRKGLNVTDFALQYGRQGLARVLANFEHVTKDAATGEFLQTWKRWLDDQDKPPLSITEPAAFLAAEFENAERALVGKRVANLGIDLVVEHDAQDSPPRMGKYGRDLAASQAASKAAEMLARGSGKDKNGEKKFKPSSRRLDKYASKAAKNTSMLEGKLRERIARQFNTITTSDMRRKMNACKLASYDITTQALDTKRHRPAGASVLFKRAMFPSQQTKTVDASAAARALKAELRREELTKLRERQGKARATINPQELLPPSLLSSKHGYRRPERGLYDKPVLAPWKYPSGKHQPDVQKRYSSRFSASGR